MLTGSPGTVSVTASVSSTETAALTPSFMIHNHRNRTTASLNAGTLNNTETFGFEANVRQIGVDLRR